jgi:hypothetical protein
MYVYYVTPVTVKPWQQSDIPIWVPFSWTLQILNSVQGPSGTLVKE